MEDKNSVEKDIVQLDLSKLLGFDQLVGLDVNTAQLLNVVDATYNKIGEGPPTVRSKRNDR